MNADVMILDGCKYELNVANYSAYLSRIVANMKTTWSICFRVPSYQPSSIKIIQLVLAINENKLARCDIRMCYGCNPFLIKIMGISNRSCNLHSNF